MLNNQRINREQIFTVTATTPNQAHTVTQLPSLTPRPNGKYAYAVGMNIKVTATITETGSVALEAWEIWQILSSLSLSYGDITRFNSYSGLDLVRRLQQMDEVLAPDIVAGFLRIAQTATGGGPLTDEEINFFVPFAPGWFKRNEKGAMDGAIPVSELQKHGHCQFSMAAGTLAGSGVNTWDWATANVEIDLLIVQLDNPIEMARVEEDNIDSSEQDFLIPGSGPRRLTGCLIADDGDTALTQPTSFSIEIDGELFTADQAGADWVDDANFRRLDGINDYAPAALPIVTGGLPASQCPMIMNRGKISRAGHAHAGNVRYLTRTQSRLSVEEQSRVFQRMGVPTSLIDRYIAEISGAVAGDDLENSIAYEGSMPASVTTPGRFTRDKAGLASVVIKG